MKKMVIIFAVFFCVSVSHAQIHFWVDENGVKHFGETPPEGAEDTKTFEESEYQENPEYDDAVKEWQKTFEKDYKKAKKKDKAERKKWRKQHEKDMEETQKEVERAEKQQEMEHAAVWGKIMVGMSKELVIKAWGEPTKIQKTKIEKGITEKWIYYYEEKPFKYVYFKNEVVRRFKIKNLK
ncbi:MAG: DUF4124 domain-containing protein [Desulfobacterales bacterium]|nr:DUF4124 domain-containing protein [Desulfobacterales bacterium]